MSKEALAGSKDAALKLALDTLKRMDGWLVLRYGSGLTPQEKRIVATMEAALAQDEASDSSLSRQAKRSSGGEQEPVGYFYLDDGQWRQAHDPISFPSCTKLYTTPPQRKPLTDDEISKIRKELSDRGQQFDSINDFVRAIEAAHGIKEKNT